MGLGGISITQLAIILVIVLLLFGTKKLRGLGGDLGGAIKGFKKAMSDDKKEDDSPEAGKVEDQTESSEELDTSKTSEKTQNK